MAEDKPDAGLPARPTQHPAVAELLADWAARKDQFTPYELAFYHDVQSQTWVSFGEVVQQIEVIFREDEDDRKDKKSP